MRIVSFQKESQPSTEAPLVPELQVKGEAYALTLTGAGAAVREVEWPKLQVATMLDQNNGFPLMIQESQTGISV